MPTKARTHLSDVYRRRRPAVSQDPGQIVARKIRSSDAWRRLARHTLDTHPLCADPLKLHGGRAVAATEVHHKNPVSQAPDLALEPSNLQALCSSCHKRVEGKS